MRVKVVLMLIALLFVAAPLFAQTPGAASSAPVVPVAVGMGIASGLCGIGQGRAVASAAEGVARNPGAVGSIRTLLLLGLAFIESLALFTFVVASR